MKEHKEHRSYPRAISKIEIVFFTDQQPDKSKGYTRDFSATGISFPVHQTIPVGSMIHLELNLPDLNKNIKTRATIIREWLEEDVKYVSVQFFDIDYHDFIILLDYSLTFQIEK